MSMGTAETGRPHAADAPPKGPTRAERKRQTIAEAATEAFLNNGYTRTSMDDIARLAGVSKQTIYMHFGDKEHLLFEIVMAIMNDASDPFDDEIHLLGESDDLETDLRQHARQQLALVLQPRPLQLRRLVIAEAVSFPQLGRSFYDSAPAEPSRSSPACSTVQQRGLLHVDDSARAASDFNWLIMSEPINKAMLLGDNEAPGPTSIATWADQAVRTFLAAYRRHTVDP